jgi:hypothetical protein
MKMRALSVVVAVCFSTAAFAQSPRPKSGIGRWRRQSCGPRWVASSLERSKGQSFGPETVRTPLNLEAPHLLPKPPHHRYLRKLQAQFLQVRNNSGAPADRAQAEGEEEMTSLLNAREQGRRKFGHAVSR